MVPVTYAPMRMSKYAGNKVIVEWVFNIVHIQEEETHWQD